MSERTSIPTWKQTHRALRDYKPENMNWPEFMALVAEDFQDGDVSAMLEQNSNAPEFDTDEVVSRVIEAIDGSSGVDEAALAEALADYLINGENLPQKVADELR